MSILLLMGGSGMATLLQLVRTYWTSNSTLAASQIPVSRVYVDMLPPPLAFPYARLFLVGALPSFNTCNTYTEETTLQIDIFDTSLNNVETLATTVMGQFDWVKFDSSVMATARTNYLVFAEQDTTQPVNNVYHAMIEYAIMQNKSY